MKHLAQDQAHWICQNGILFSKGNTYFSYENVIDCHYFVSISWIHLILKNFNIHLYLIFPKYVVEQG